MQMVHLDPWKSLLIPVAPVVAFCLLFGSACSDSIDNQAEKEADWFQSCSGHSECGDRKCICSVCTTTCQNDLDCQEADPSATCVEKGSDVYRAQCQCKKREETAICLPQCASNVSCGPGSKCWKGSCVPKDSNPWVDRWNATIDLFPDLSEYMSGVCSQIKIGESEAVYFRESYRYDEKGNEVYIASNDSEHDEIHITDYSYDRFGHRLSGENDFDGDCTIDTRLRFGYDEFGNLISQETDRHADGLVDERLTVVYDERCNLLSREKRAESGDGDEETRNFTYDENGNLIRVEIDYQADDTIDNITTYRYDDEGILLIMDITDYDGDEVIDHRNTIVYNDQWCIETIETEQRVDSGNFSHERTITMTYDEDGRLLTERRSEQSGDVFVDIYNYDSSGHLMSKEHQHPPGTMKGKDEFSYSCSDEESIECIPPPPSVPVHYDAECDDPFEEGYPSSNLNRDADPVVLSGDKLEMLLEREPNRLVAFRYTDSWEQIPVQVDERKLIDFDVVYDHSQLICPGAFYRDPSGFSTLVYADDSTTVGLDPNPLIDSDDEIVFMLKDAGGQLENFADPDGVVADSGVRIQIRYPDEEHETQYVYLFTSKGSLEPSAGVAYGSYSFSLNAGSYPEAFDFCAGPNLEDSWFRSDYYSRHFSDRWISDVIEITAPGASGVDILDAHNFDDNGTVCVPSVVTASNAEGAFINNINGPVRSIRSYVGMHSGVLNQRTHFFYQRRETIVTNLRVHSMDADAAPDTIDYLDFSKEAIGMRAFTCSQLEGVTIDGVPDEVWLVTTSLNGVTDTQAWSLITGDQGTLVVVQQVDSSFDRELVSFYRDQASAERMTVNTCVGDDAYYGAIGSKMVSTSMPCTDADCEDHLVLTRNSYYLEPNLTVSDARQLSRHVYHPPTISVSAIRDEVL